VRVLRALYRNNPFYLVSALLVLFGLKAVFPPEGSPAYDWALMGLLAAYTSLLAATACLIVRLGKVWDDARTILLTIALLLMALSVSFDEKIVSYPVWGSGLLAGGLAFSVLITEILLRKLGIRLPRLFRLPLYLALSCFFLYPLFLTALLHRASPRAIEWGVAGFSPIFALGLLTLLPAARRGGDDLGDSGTPWKWPWFPWVLFGVLTLGACARASYLSISFGSGHDADSSFAPYFLAPIVLAVSLLALEAGRAAKSAMTQRLALALSFLPLFSFALEPSLSPAQSNFLRLFLEDLPSPVYLTLLGMAILHGYACLRRAAGGETSLLATLLSLAVVGPGTLGVEDLSLPRAAPLLVLGAVELALALKQRASWRFFLSGAAFLAAVTVSLAPWGSLRFHGAIPLHAFVALAIFLGAAFKDPFARFLQNLGAGGLFFLFLSALALNETVVPGLAGWRLCLYLGGILAAQIVSWKWTRNVAYLVTGFLAAGLGALQLAWQGWLGLRTVILPRGLGRVLAGMAFFVLAAWISLYKARAVASPAAWLRRLRGRQRNGEGNVLLEGP
jgi:hypothetical protein